MLLTLKQAKNSSLADVASTCPNGATFLRRLNEATERLMNRGDFKGTLVPIQICVKQGCVVWPRYVGEIRGINLCTHPMPVKGLWYRWMQPVELGACQWQKPEAVLSGMGEVPTYNTVHPDGRLIRAYPMADKDVGKTITIFGEDDNGQVLHTKDPFTGEWSDGEVITIAKPYGSTTSFVRAITRVLKDETEGPVRLYAYDAVNDVLEDLAYYECTETNPAYTRHSLNFACCVKPSNGDCPTAISVTALVKLRFVPAAVDTDLVLIENTAALKNMMQSIQFENAGDYANANAAEARAVRELNLQLWNSTPETATPVNIQPFGGTGIGRQRMW